MHRPTAEFPLQKEPSSSTSRKPRLSNNIAVHQIENRSLPPDTCQLEINEGHYIGVFPENQKLQTICEENDVALLKGTYLFTVPPSCSLKTSKFTNKNEKGFVVGHSITLQDIKGINIPTMQLQKWNIKKVSLDKLHKLQLGEKTQSPLDLINLHADPSQWCIWSVATLIILILVYPIIIRRKEIYRRSTNQRRKNHTLNETQVVPPSSSF
ncbi:hypothetical protein JTB14_006321 [Gonioctena quinquepunctata]|nr:hypothetical protein JTB14_006321 [Gonioctena quinquepunctata]